ncbi:hypothetical protein SAMN04488550_3955 [Gordonia malaquae]|uniref:Uncharacterized protein n=1 Tax=Gordonia malaquae NBRC 108250 TaxID=1223542 RepID=M3TG85_GORML|nr:hypothetical protein [Gordonia malaquae]GAC80481.1 hypothetical protein GM1_018_00440 [Gordonia malaquae NBRC 108250]SEE15684.1 hypothetical protein SAMN04488550_3955 [Gordonia malaquae]
MGVFDSVKKASQNLAVKQSAEDNARVATMFPGVELPRVDYIPKSREYGTATPTAYIATVGLLPEEFGILPVNSESAAQGFEFVYRDRPEYARGRAAWHRHHG